MMDALVSTLPVEITGLIAKGLSYADCQRFGSPLLRRHVGSQAYWHGRQLKIVSRDQLGAILRDVSTRQARCVDLTAADIDDADLAFVASHFASLKVVRIGRNPDLTDHGLEVLLRLHGPTLSSVCMEKLFRLTNYTLEMMARYCLQLRKLSVEGCMFTFAGVRLLLQESTFRLEKVCLSRCHLVDTRELPALTMGLESVRQVELAHIDGLEPYQVQALLKDCLGLKRLDITGCPEITLKAIRAMKCLRPDVEIVHAARLEDHTIDGIRRFLLGLIS